MADETVVAAGDVTEEVQNPAEEVETAEGSTPQATENEGETEEGHKKKLGGWQRKQLKAEQEAARWREIALEALSRKEPAPVEKKEQPAEDKRPRKEDFKIDDEHYDPDKYEEAVDEWRDRQYEKKLAKALEEREQKSKQLSEQERVEQSWREKESAFEADHDDYQEFAIEATKFLQAHQQSPTAQALGVAITESEIGPALLRELGEDYETLERIAKLSPLAAVRELGKIEGRLAQDKSADTQEAEEELEPANPPVKPLPKPPTHEKKVGSIKKPSIYDPNLPYSEWKKLREAELQRK